VISDEGADEWTPYLTNMTDDPATTGTLKIFLVTGRSLVVGSRDHGHLLASELASQPRGLKRGASAADLGGGHAALPVYRRDLELDGLGMEATHACFASSVDVEAPPQDIEFGGNAIVAAGKKRFPKHSNTHSYTHTHSC